MLKREGSHELTVTVDDLIEVSSGRSRSREPWIRSPSTRRGSDWADGALLCTCKVAQVLPSLCSSEYEWTTGSRGVEPGRSSRVAASYAGGAREKSSLMGCAYAARSSQREPFISDLRQKVLRSCTTGDGQMPVWSWAYPQAQSPRYTCPRTAKHPGPGVSET